MSVDREARRLAVRAIGARGRGQVSREAFGQGARRALASGGDRGVGAAMIGAEAVFEADGERAEDAPPRQTLDPDERAMLARIHRFLRSDAPYAWDDPDLFSVMDRAERALFEARGGLRPGSRLSLVGLVFVGAAALVGIGLWAFGATPGSALALGALAGGLAAAPLGAMLWSGASGARARRAREDLSLWPAPPDREGSP
ncbi:MAG: hypothetical protein AAFW46_12240 [Pseudomonadota bacterium]